MTRGVLSWAASALLHAAALGLLFVAAPDPQRDHRSRPPVRVRLVPPAEPPPPPKPEPEPEPPPQAEAPPEPPPVVEAPPQAEPPPQPPDDPPPRRARKRPRKTPTKPLRARKVDRDPQPAAEAAAPAPAAKTPPAFAIDMEATIPAGGVAVPAADGARDILADAGADRPPDPTARERKRRRAPLRGAGDGDGDDPVAVTEVTRMPRLLRDLTDDEQRAGYPPEALRKGVELDVRLDLLIGANGRVEAARSSPNLGYGFGPAARALATRHLRFRPALQGDRPVAVWIQFTIRFRIQR